MPSRTDQSPDSAPARRGSSPDFQWARGVVGWIRKNPLLLASTGFFILFCLFIWWIRPIGFIRGPFMAMWRHPAVVTLPLFSFLSGAFIHALIKTSFGDRYQTPERGRYHRRPQNPRLLGTFLTALCFACVGFLIALVWTGGWTADAIYAHIKFRTLTPQMLEGANMRVKPYDVAQEQIQTSLNSSTDNTAHLSIIEVNGRLTWTAARVPNGFWRGFSHGSDGIVTDGAESSLPNVSVNTPETTAEFDWSPGAKFAKSFDWHAHEICYTCDIVEVVGVPTPRGPMLVAPYVTWHGGLFVDRPVFSGVFIERPGGYFKKLSAAQAESDRELVATGHIFPAGLALRMAQSYAYKNGIANKIFTHKEQYDVDEEASAKETDEQPYLEDFKSLGTQWVTTMKPNGSTYSTGAIITTSVINGETRIWLTPKQTPLIDAGKAIEIVRGQPIAGVTFANANSSDVGGKYLAIEPRQVFPPGHGLQFLVSVVPSEETRVSLNIVVDARTQSVAGIFQADPQGDSDLVSYLNTGYLPPSELYTGPGAGSQGVTGESESATTPTTPLPNGTGAQATIERLLAENKAAQAQGAKNLKSLHAEQTDLEDLLTGAKSAKK
jgi:hypothetical protein